MSMSNKKKIELKKQRAPTMGEMMKKNPRLKNIMFAVGVCGFSVTAYLIIKING